MMNGVSVGVRAGRVAVFVAWTASVLIDKADWARIASLLDINPVMATYIPSMTTSKMIKKPKAYPLFMNPTVPWIVWNAAYRNTTMRTDQTIFPRRNNQSTDALYSKSQQTANRRGGWGMGHGTKAERPQVSCD
jgi:hypothetical protein